MLTVIGNFPDTMDNLPFCKVNQQCVVMEGSTAKWVSGEVITQAIQPYIVKAMKRDSGQFIPGAAHSAWFGPVNCTVTGEVEPIPSYINSQIFSRSKTNTGLRWKRRKETGEMIVTPCLRGSLRLDFIPGLETITFEHRSLGTNTNAKNCGLFPVTPEGYFVVGNLTVVTNFAIQRFYRKMTRVQGRDPRPKNWSPKMYEWEIKNTILSQGIDRPLVTETLASANSATVEVISTLAEMPKTVKESLDGIMKIVEMYKDARKQAVRIYNKAKGRSSAQTIYKNVREAADAIVKVWMTWRFGIRPNVYLLEDTIEIIYSQFKDYYRYRKFKQKLIDPPGIPGLSVDDKVTLNNRCMIKRHFDVDMPYNKIMQHLTANGPIALYELTPLSWMLDYFTNVGDYFATLLNNSVALNEVSTYSWQIPLQTVSYGDDESGYILATFGVYRRDLINPSDETCIVFSPDLDSQKLADIASVAWNIFKNDLPARLPNFRVSKTGYTE